jgi:hypothetical protein
MGMIRRNRKVIRLRMSWVKSFRVMTRMGLMVMVLLANYSPLDE